MGDTCISTTWHWGRAGQQSREQLGGRRYHIPTLTPALHPRPRQSSPHALFSVHGGERQSAAAAVRSL